MASRFKLTSLFALLCLWLAGPSLAEQSVEISDYTVHYSAFNSAFLQPSVAKTYGVSRSRYQGVVSISLMKHGDEANPKSHGAFITGKAINLSSQEKNLKFTEVKEGDAIYYISTFPYVNNEHLRFEIQVTPEGDERPHNLTFKQWFYVD